MEIEGWKYYNHAAIPDTPPIQDVDLSPISNHNIWKLAGGMPLLARWTSNFDCGYETNWWYVIKDTPLDIDSLKAKRRYEINKGIKNFEVKIIEPCAYREELYRVQVAAFSAYPEKYRPVVDKKRFISGLDGWNKYAVFGAFFRESGELAGYAFLSEISENFIEFNVLKTDPRYEKYAINAALVTGVLSYYQSFLKAKGIICDGARSVSHETNFQDYLEKYFGFRKAYCHLHIKYNPKVLWLIKMLYPFRNLLKNFDTIGIVHQINSVMKMEELYRNEVQGV